MGIDSQRFLLEVQSFQEHGLNAFDSFYGYQYLSYVVFLAFIFKAGGGLGSVVLLQLLFSAMATVTLYYLTLKISGSEWASFWACCFFLLWVELQSWNFYILTESLFITCGILSFYFLVKAWENAKYSWVVLPLLIFTIFIRPHGVVYFLAVVIFLFSSFSDSTFYKENKKSLRRAALLVSLLMIVLIGVALEDFTFMSIDVYKTGDIVYGASIIFPEEEILSMQTQSLEHPNPELPTAIQLVQFIFLNPVFFFRLSLAKLFFFFVHIKPYYSLLHNMLIAVTLYPLYGLFLVGIKTSKRSPVKTFVLAFIVLEAASVMFMVEDWDGRFLMPILPFIMVYAAIGMMNLIAAMPDGKKKVLSLTFCLNGSFSKEQE